MNVLTIILLITVTLTSGEQQLATTDEITTTITSTLQTKSGFNHEVESVARSIDVHPVEKGLREERGLRVPIISEIQDILRPTKPSIIDHKQEQKMPQIRPTKSRPGSPNGSPINNDNEGNVVNKQPMSYPKPDDDMDNEWDNDVKPMLKPIDSNPPWAAQKPPILDGPQTQWSNNHMSMGYTTDPWEDDVPVEPVKVPNREPNTIQEWMNENRPISQIRPQIPNESHEANPPINEYPRPPWDDNQDEIKPSIIYSKPDSRPQPIKPSYQPPPWEQSPSIEYKPTSKPSFEDEDNEWWNKPTTPKSTKPNSPFDAVYDEWDDTDDSESHKRKPPILQSQNPSINDNDWWPQSPAVKPESQPQWPPIHSNPSYNPKPEPEFDYRPPAYPHKPSKPEIPATAWTGNPNLPSWWDERPSKPEPPHPEPDDDLNGIGGNHFGENTGNGIGGVGDTNGLGGAMVGNSSGNGEGGVGKLNGLGGNVIQSNGANGVGGVGTDNGLGGFIVGHDSGNGKGGVGDNNGIGGNKGGKNSANGTGGVGNNNGKGGLIVGSHSGNGIGGVNQNLPGGAKPIHKP